MKQENGVFVARCTLQTEKTHSFITIHSRTINTVTNLKVNCLHNFKDNIISLLYGLPTSVMNIEHQSFFKMAAFGLHTVPKTVATHLLYHAVSPLGNPPLLSSGSASGFWYWGAYSYRSCLQALPTHRVHWAEVGAAEGSVTQSQTLVELALRAGTKSCLKPQCSLLNKVLLKNFTTDSQHCVLIDFGSSSNPLFHRNGAWWWHHMTLPNKTMTEAGWLSLWILGALSWVWDVEA